MRSSIMEKMTSGKSRFAIPATFYINTVDTKPCGSLEKPAYIPVITSRIRSVKIWFRFVKIYFRTKKLAKIWPIFGARAQKSFFKKSFLWWRILHFFPQSRIQVFGRLRSQPTQPLWWSQDSPPQLPRGSSGERLFRGTEFGENILRRDIKFLTAFENLFQNCSEKCSITGGQYFPGITSKKPAKWPFLGILFPL